MVLRHLVYTPVLSLRNQSLVGFRESSGVQGKEPKQLYSSKSPTCHAISLPPSLMTF